MRTLLALLVLTLTAQAQTVNPPNLPPFTPTTQTVSAGDWDSPSIWSDGLPTKPNDALVTHDARYWQRSPPRTNQGTLTKTGTLTSATTSYCCPT